MHGKAEALSIGGMARAWHQSRADRSGSRQRRSRAKLPDRRRPSSVRAGICGGAEEARACGTKNVLHAITVDAKPATPQSRISAQRFAAQVAWKRRVLMKKPAR